MFSSFEEAHAYVGQQGIRMVDLKFSDLWGRWHHVSIPAHEFNTNLMRDGIGFDGSSVA